MNLAERVRRIEPEEHVLPSGEKMEVGLFRPEDGAGIGELFRTIYGDGYPARHVYDPVELAAALERGDNYPVVARGPVGKIIGHVALFRSSPYGKLFEAGAGAVLPEHRNAGINRLLLAFAYERLAPELELEETWGEAVCNHIYMQRTIATFNHVETALEVALMPAEAYEKERSAAGRVASVAVFRAYRPRPHVVRVPEAYAEALRFLYAGLDDARTLSPGEADIPPDSVSRAEVGMLPFAGVARMAVARVGGDFESRLDALEKDVLPQGFKVIQVSLGLGRPWIDRAVSALRGRGYFLGGVLPRWFDEDALLMQKIIGDPCWEGIRLFSERAAKILELVREDWRRTQ
ncbi:GNAT family N-acetyltransferase [Syntrophobacter fumaroxidans]|uniref:N-acetyltransferase domain-containing protein n=1 Tax=Syntrophobacter fumaroxidans (strain DSM 10017 / MPOB) TaxID=335543 RepID=A0LJU5_SYNFM|nr:GNAT family N-acetyltransferase [Syntrophobacter fumaroxidans]ABK17697.1 hypothetical protein Sfum_2014 [Syntrophobacter fumaroxidans MPOB]